MASTKVAIVTGGASGMGLAVVENLVERGWNVAIVDKNSKHGEAAKERLGAQTEFFETNVADWDQQSKVFVETWDKWGRIDFVFANAGISDKIDFLAPAKQTVKGAPEKPDTLVLDVCLTAVIYSSYLALHYFRKNESKGGLLVMTSSTAGIYAAPGVTIYGAAKHGVIGLARSLALRLRKSGEPIAVNALCPSFTPTGLVNPKLIAKVPKEYVTPTATIVRAVEQWINDPRLTGQVAECSGEEIFERPVIPFSNKGSEWTMTGGLRTLLDPGEDQAVQS